MLINTKNRLLLILAALLTISFIGGSAINYRITKSAVRHEIVKNDLPLTMDNIYSDLTNELVRPIMVASSMASDTFLKDWVQDGEQDQEKIRKYLAEIQDEYGFFSTFFVSSYTSRYYHFKGVHKQISPADSHDVWYYQFIGSEKEYDLDVDTDEASNNILTVFINYRVVDDKGRLLGVTGVGLKMANVAELVQSYEERYGRNVYLTDRNGTIQVHKNTSLIENTSISELRNLEGIAGQILSTTKQPGNFEFDRDGDKILLNVRYIDIMDWFLFVEQNESNALMTAKMNFVRSVIIGILASILIIVVTLTTINKYQKKLELLATTDELTRVANRHKLEEEFKLFAYRFSRSRHPFCLILLDLDGFKHVNDTLGHIHGDTVLQQVSQAIRSTLRPTDVLARWGGDEFTILTENSIEVASQMAERIRTIVDELEWPDIEAPDPDPREDLSVSLGVVSYEEGHSLDLLIHMADERLYRSKELGGNRVEVS